MRNSVTEAELAKSAADRGAQRVTLADIEGAIVSEHYFTASDGVMGSLIGEPRSMGIPTDLRLLTICTLRLWNGFVILGQSACADPAAFDAELGRRLARAHAVNQIWPLMGYELKSRIAREASRHEMRQAQQDATFERFKEPE